MSRRADPAPTTVSVRRSPRAWWTALVTTAVATGVTVMLVPVLVSPVNSDERYQYLIVPARAQGDWWELVRWSWEEIPFRAAQGGRVTPVGYYLQRPFYNGVAELSVATGVPIHVLHGVVKILLLALAVVVVTAFVASVRGRDDRGRPVRVGRGVLGLVAVATTVMTAVGAQAHYSLRNGWVTFPVLTYLAVTVVFGVCALALWAAGRLHRRPGTLAGGVVAAGAAVVGVLLTLSYELYFVAFPAALLALALQPLGPAGDPRAGRRVKAVVAGGLSLGFLTSLALVRSWVSRLCTDRECYEGTQPQLGLGVVRTTVENLLSALPGSGLGVAAQETRDLGFVPPGPFSTVLVLACVAAGAGLVGARAVGSRVLVAERDARGSEIGVLLRAAVVACAVCLGSAGIMALSVQAQEEVAVGLPYRNTVLTWMSLVLAGACLLLALDRMVPRRQARALWGAAGAAAALVGALVLPVDLAVARATAASGSAVATAAIHHEITLGDPTEVGAERRCRALEALQDSPAAARAKANIAEGAQDAYRYFHGRPFCDG